MKIIYKVIKFFDPKYLFGKDTEIGPPINQDLEGAYMYFDSVYKDSAKFAEVLDERFHLNGLKVVSIASGFGAEEACFAERGAKVDCIEPDKFSVDVMNHKISHMDFQKGGKESIKDFVTTLQNFNTDKKYDLIYTASPSDWMYSDFRNLIPDYFIDFFNKYGGDNSIIILRLCGGAYRARVLKSKWFIYGLASKIKKHSKYSIREYWMDRKGDRATIVLSNLNSELPDFPDFKFCLSRYNELSYLRYSFKKDDIIPESFFSSLVPYILALRRLLSKVVTSILVNLKLKKT